MMPVVVVAGVKTTLSHREDTTMTRLRVVIEVKTKLLKGRTMTMVPVKIRFSHREDTNRGGRDCDVCPRLLRDHGHPPQIPLILKPLCR